MKRKHLLTLLVAIALLVTAGVFVAQADTEGTACSHCDQPVAANEWKLWSFTEGKATAGHYYLPDAFTAQDDTITIPADVDVCLDLRGNIYNTEDIKVFSVSGTLSIVDSVGGGMVLTTGQSDQLGGFASVSATGTLNLYGGTVRFVEKDSILIAGGGLVFAHKGTVNIHGGILQGGVARPTVIAERKYRGYGGNIYLFEGATLNMTAGGIVGGTSRLNPEYTPSGVHTVGGNILAEESTVNISGGKVSDGYSDGDGGNIYLLTGSTLNLSGEGVVENGHAYNNGGNISLYSFDNTINISGGTITGGVAGSEVSSAPFTDRGIGGGGNLYINTSGGVLNISGGTIDGDIKVNIVGTLTLSGEPIINLGKANGLHLKKGVKADVSGMTGGTVYVDATGVFAENVENAATVATYFKGAIRTAVAADDTTLVATQGTTGYCPGCRNEVTWTSVNENWTANGTCSTDGHYYLTGMWNASQTIDANVTLDLNGWTIGAEDSRVFSIQGQLDVLDSFGGGQIIGTNNLTASADDAPVVYVLDGKTFTLHNGTVRRVDPWTTDNEGKQANACLGGVIYAADAAVVNIKGGVIRDGIVNAWASGTPGPAGGNIGFDNVNGVFTMSAGILKGGEAKEATSDTTTYPGVGGNLFTPGAVTISGGYILDGRATDGGNLFFEQANDITRTINGGTIRGGDATSEGGNIYQAGVSGYASTLNITNANVLYGDAYDAGNIYVAYGTVNINAGAMVSGGAATNNGGNILAADGGKVTIDGGLLAGGAATGSTGRGGNIYIASATSDALVLKNNGMILDGYAGDMGGNISSAGVIALESGLVSSGSAGTGGGNVFVTDAGQLNMTGGEISKGSADLGGNIYIDSADASCTLSTGTLLIANGTATTNGGNIYMNAGTLTAQTGTITGGKAANNGGNIYINAGETLVQAGTISAGTATKNGGNIYINAGTLTAQTGTISGGTATNNGGNIYINAGEMLVQAGTITGGTAKNNGGNVYIYNKAGSLTLNGGTITGGKAANNGGNVYIYSGTLTLDGGTITKGTANSAVNASQWYYNGGGNIYVNDAATAKAYIVSGTVSDGTATNNSGGNILCRGNGTLTVSGGTISGGKSGYPGASIMNGASKNVTISGGTISGGTGNTRNRMPQDGDNIAAFGGTLTVSGGTIQSDGNELGNGILAYYNAKIVLDGDAKITNTGKFGNIYIAKQSGTATLHVKNTFTGEAGVAFHAEHGLDYAATLNYDSSTGPYTGTVYAEELELATIYGTDENTLVVAGILVNDTWYQNNESAMDATDGDATIKVFTSDELPLKGASYVVDLNGQNVKMTGTGDVTCYDSANDTYEVFGSATLEGPILMNDAAITVDNKTYFKLEDNGVYSFHRANYQLIGVSLRPSISGIYFTGKWEADDMLKTHIDAFGVAVNLIKIPDSSFRTDSSTMWTTFENKEFESGVTRNGVMISGIVKDQDPNRIAMNDEYGKLKIYAAAYITVDGQDYAGVGASSSLFDVLDYVNSHMDAYSDWAETMQEFMDKWDDYGLTPENGYDFSFEVKES